MPEAQVLIPVRQDTVDFDGYPVIGVLLPDGRIAASLRDHSIPGANWQLAMKVPPCFPSLPDADILCTEVILRKA